MKSKGQNPKKRVIEIPQAFDFIACDITTNCNLRCPFCINDFSRIKKTEFMNTETFEKILSLFPLIKSDSSFFFSCLFEPTIHPNYLALLRMIPENEQHKVFFTTNLAKHIPNDIFEELTRLAIRHINISLDSLNPDTYHSMRKGGSFDVFYDNLKRLVAIFSKNPRAPKLRYITILCKSNIGEVVGLVEQSSKRFLAIEHELRCFQPFSFQNQEWIKANIITKKDWNNLKHKLRHSPYPTSFGPHYDQRHIVDPYHPVDNWTKVYWVPSYVSLQVLPSGEVDLMNMLEHISFNIHDIKNPLPFFKSILALHALDIARGKELNRIIHRNPFDRVISFLKKMKSLLAKFLNR